MATDTDPLFRALAEDADRARLDAPADLRRRGDRRTATGAAVTTVGVVAVVAALLMGGGALLGDSSRGLSPVDPATPAVAGSKSPAAPMTLIPPSAWLDAADLNDAADPIESDDELLRPCTEALLGPANSQVML